MASAGAALVVSAETALVFSAMLVVPFGVLPAPRQC